MHILGLSLFCLKKDKLIDIICLAERDKFINLSLIVAINFAFRPADRFFRYAVAQSLPRPAAVCETNSSFRRASMI